VDRRAEERAASHETGHAFERLAEEEGLASRVADGGERDGGREPTTTSGPVSTPSASYASVSSVSATIASSAPAANARTERVGDPAGGQGRQSRRVPDLPRTPPRSGRHRGGQLLGGTGAAHRPSRARRNDVRRRCASGHQHDHAQRLLVPGHYRRAGPAGAGRCWRPWVSLRSCRVCARLSGARTTIRSVAGPDQDLHDR
jgi:hypothetical protein